MLKLRKKYKSGNAFESIRDAILFGDISGQIAQNEFADSLGVSRIPVREALITLEYHGLIEKLPNQHVEIIELNESSVKDLFTDMSLLELEVIKSLSSEKLQTLSSLSHSEFHREICWLTKSPLRKIFLKTIIETYLMFVLEHSDLTSVFGKLQSSLGNFADLRNCYSIYADALASELIDIRRLSNS